MRKTMGLCLALHLFATSAPAAVVEGEDDCVKPAASLAKRYSPRDVEIRLRDASRLRGEIIEIDALSIRTPYGELKVPVSDLRSLSRGDRLTAEEVQGMEGLLKGLDSEEYEKRQASQKSLESFGMRAFDLLSQAMANASPERHTRLQAMLKKIVERDGNRPQPQDVVRTKHAEVRGLLEDCPSLFLFD